MQILIESYTPAEAQIITESLNDYKDIYLNGVFMESEARNRNGRIYQRHELAAACATLNETIKIHGGVLGEIDHPSNRLSSELKHTSHIITEVRMDGNKGVGKMKLIPTPSGLIIKEIIKAGYRPGVSTRGAGHVNEQGIVENFSIQTVDIVVVQSAHNALPETVYESLELMKTGREASKIAEDIMNEQLLVDHVRKDERAQAHFKKAIDQFIDELVKRNKK